MVVMMVMMVMMVMVEVLVMVVGVDHSCQPLIRSSIDSTRI